MLIITDDNLQRAECVIFYEAIKSKNNETTWAMLLPVFKKLKIDELIVDGLIHVTTDQALQSLFNQRCDVKNNDICIFHNFSRY